MNMSDYQAFTPTTNLVPTAEHVTNGLFAEAGEVAGVYQKYYRGDFGQAEKSRRLKKEIGGLLWYLSELCNMEGFSIEDIAAENMKQLLDRKKRNMIRGDGDDR